MSVNKCSPIKPTYLILSFAGPFDLRIFANQRIFGGSEPAAADPECPDIPKSCS